METLQQNVAYIKACKNYNDLDSKTVKAIAHHITHYTIYIYSFANRTEPITFFCPLSHLVKATSNLTNGPERV